MTLLSGSNRCYVGTHYNSSHLSHDGAVLERGANRETEAGRNPLLLDFYSYRSPCRVAIATFQYAFLIIKSIRAIGCGALPISKG